MIDRAFLPGPLLVVAPHPDDETLGCGGTLSRAAREGAGRHWLIATDMAAAPRSYQPQRIAQRAREIEAVTRLYGFASVHALGRAPSELTDADIPDLVAAVGAVLDAIRPATILIPNERDAHTDHAIVHRAVAAASKAFRRPFVRALLVYETLSETGQNPSMTALPFRPNLYVALQATDIDLKCRAMNTFESEVAPFPFPRSERALRALADLRGAESGNEAAEAFEVARASL